MMGACIIPSMATINPEGSIRAVIIKHGQISLYIQIVLITHVNLSFYKWPIFLILT